MSITGVDFVGIVARDIEQSQSMLNNCTREVQNEALGQIQHLFNADFLSMIGDSEIQKMVEQLVSLLVSLGWNKCDATLSSVRRSISLGDPNTCMDIIMFLMCRFEDRFGREMLSLYKINVPPDEVTRTQSKLKDLETDVDQTDSDSIRRGIEFILGPKHQLNIRFRRVSKFMREVLGIHTMYLQESQFARQGFAKKKLNMISDMIEAMKKSGKGRKGAKRNHCTSHTWDETVCKSREEFVNPRDKSPPCLFRDTSNILTQGTLDSVSIHEGLPSQDLGFEQIDSLGSISDILHIGESVIDEQDYVTPQTTNNPLFWTFPEISPDCSDSYISEDEFETATVNDHFTNQPSCLLESLQLRAQQALKVLDNLYFK